MNPESEKHPPSPPRLRIESEEEVYRYESADNGASPLWCMGSTSLVRVGDETFASGIETLPGVKPLHNCRWMLFRRASDGWALVRKDEKGRTREPCPLAAYPDGRVFLSANPTLTAPDTYDGPAQPQVFEFSAADPGMPPKLLLPRWSEAVTFNEHSYRHFAADAEGRELILFQNLSYDRAYWSLFDREGRWSAQGKITWPWGADYEEPQVIRLCYCNVLLRNRAVHIWGMSDIVEPRKAWKEYKFKITGRKWDYEMRRLFYSWTPDIAREPFRPWIEVASREQTAGHAQNCDLWVGGDGAVHLLWRERAIDERLRKEFFPGERQVYSLNYARLKDGAIQARQVIAQGGEGISDELPGWCRFHPMPDGRLFAILSIGGKDASGGPLSQNRLVEIGADGKPGPAATLALKHPLMDPFFTTTPRGGSPPSDTIELLGVCEGTPTTVRYTRIRLAGA
jgi:hypothetical protein